MAGNIIRWWRSTLDTWSGSRVKEARDVYLNERRLTNELLEAGRIRFGISSQDSGQRLSSAFDDLKLPDRRRQRRRLSD